MQNERMRMTPSDDRRGQLFGTIAVATPGM